MLNWTGVVARSGKGRARVKREGGVGHVACWCEETMVVVMDRMEINVAM
jgi:hypothetical protein